MKKLRRTLIFGIVLVFAISALILVTKTEVKIKANTGGAEEPQSKINLDFKQTAYEKYIEEKTAAHKEAHGEATLTPQVAPITVLGKDFTNREALNYTNSKFEKYVEEKDINDILSKITNPTNSEYSTRFNANYFDDSATFQAGETILALHRDGELTYKFTVAEAGFYNLYITYYTYNAAHSNIDRSLKINGVTPFEDCGNFTFTRVWEDNASGEYNGLKKTNDGNNIIYTKNWRNDVNGNELKPQQTELFYTKVTAPFKDSMGYVTEPFEFYFEAGDNTVTLDVTKETFLIDCLELRSVTKSVSYAEYKEALINNAATEGRISFASNPKGVYTRIEGEASTTKSSPTLFPITDRSSSATTPFSITKNYLNSIGGDNWKVLGDWIAWEFEVPETGYYNISMRAKQNLIRGMFSTRSFYIARHAEGQPYGEYETLFEEMNQLQISYNNKWKNVTLGNSNDEYLFYFEKGYTYSLKMEVTLGDYAPLIARLQNIITELQNIYRNIISYTTLSPDTSRDYELDKKFDYLFYGQDEAGDYTVKKQGEFYIILNELTKISNEIKDISGGGSDKTGVIDSVVVILQKMVDKPRTIPQRLNTYSTNVSSLGSLLNELREAPLYIDYLEVHTPDVSLPKPNAGFFKTLWTGIANFFASFFIDYSSISETENANVEDITIEVWMTLGRDQANVTRSLIDESFREYAIANYKNHTNINVDLKLTGGDVLLKATLAGIGPDVALNVDSSLPVNYGLRGAVLDLTAFDDFWNCVYVIPDGSVAYDDTYENIYMASSLRQFSFSKLIVPDDSLFDSERYSVDELKAVTDRYVTIKGKEVKNTEIYALPEKQIFLMMFINDEVMDSYGLNKNIETWDDMIDLVAELQARQLQFYLPVNDSGASGLNSVFVSLLYQYGGKLYDSNNMECGFKSEAAMEAFEYWTELYTNYSFPTAASFINRFRTGEMPIGISFYEMYNSLSVFAPELKGKWSFKLIPGTVKTDEHGVEYIDHTATASGTGCVLMKKEVSVNDNSALGYKITDKGYAAWTFLKWWTSSEVQAQFGTEMEGILGSAARHTTANVKALENLAWSGDDLQILMEQWAHVHEMPQIAGSYITGREIENAYREVINKFNNARETLYEYAQKIDTEINRKRNEFNLPLLSDVENN